VVRRGYNKPDLPLLSLLLPSSIEEKITTTMVIAAAAVLALGVGSAAYAGEGGGARGAAHRRRPHGCTTQALNERAVGSPLFAARLTQVVEDRLLAALVKHPCVSLDGETAGVRLRVR
jgi:hypothetical protein